MDILDHITCELLSADEHVFCDQLEQSLPWTQLHSLHREKSSVQSEQMQSGFQEHLFLQTLSHKDGNDMVWPLTQNNFNNTLSSC